MRSGVLTALRAFQAGYIQRDPKDLDSFMSRLIAKNDDVLILGTDAGEWVRGYPAAAGFIRADWQGWGDFRFAVEDSIICSDGDVAWTTSTGDVHFKGANRALRFSAILKRDGSNWLFHELHFQWDDRDPSPADVLRPKTYFKLLRLAFRQVTSTP
ncbi:MAG: nuclear transport factor 2 family protein [Terracidiphilus sp.]